MSLFGCTKLVFFAFLLLSSQLISVEPENMPKYRAIILLGPPGSGKGTVGQIVAQAGEQVHLSTGEMFRSLDPTTEVGQKVSQTLEQGQLVSDSLTIEVWQEYVKSLIASGKFEPGKQLLILDGIPRNAAQVDLLKPHIDPVRVVVLEVSDKEILIERLIRRGQIEGRSDDQKREVLETRMRVYEERTAEVVSHYPKEIICRVRADQKRLQVLRDLLECIANLVP